MKTPMKKPMDGDPKKKAPVKKKGISKSEWAVLAKESAKRGTNLITREQIKKQLESKDTVKKKSPAKGAKPAAKGAKPSAKGAKPAAKKSYPKLMMKKTSRPMTGELFQ